MNAFKFFKDQNNGVYQIVGDGLEDKTLLAIRPDLVEITEEEADQLRGKLPPVDQVKVDRKNAIDAAYQAAIQQDIYFTTAAGVTETFQADLDSQSVLMQATQGYQIAGATPSGFYWKATDNTQVDFTLLDLQRLYSAVLARGWEVFQKRTALKAQINAATTIDAVQAVSW